HDVTGHVTQGAGAEVPPAAPGEGAIGGVIGTLRRGSEPQVPGDVGWDGGCVGGALTALRPDGAVGPDVDFLDVSDDATLDPLHLGGAAFGGVTLVAHLGHDLGLAGLGDHLAGFADVVGKRLLAVDVLAHAHGHD